MKLRLTRRSRIIVLLLCVLLVTTIEARLLIDLGNNASAKPWVESPLLPVGMRTGMLDLVPDFVGTSELGITYSINHNGYRDDPVDLSKQHVIFLGDSTTFGLNIEHEDTYAEVWERVAGGNCQAINTAAPGHGTITEYRELQDVLARGVHPVGVVVGFYVSNVRDGRWDNTTWENSAKYLRRIHDLTTEHGIPLVILYLPSWTGDLNDLSTPRNTVAAFATQEHIHFVDGIAIYTEYMAQNELTEIPTSFYSHATDLAHPSPLTSRLLGEALAAVLLCPAEEYH